MTQPSSAEMGIERLDKKIVVVPDTGTNVSRLHALFPILKEHPDIKHSFEVHNPGKSEAVVVIPGLRKEDVERFKKGKMFEHILEKLDDTVVLFDWPPYTHIPEYTAAQLEDLFLLLGISKAKIIGASYGGHVALELLADIKRNKIPVEITGLITVVSPVDANDLQPPSQFARKMAPLMQLSKMVGILRADNPTAKDKLAHSRSVYARLRAFRDKPFTKEEMPAEVPVLAVTTRGGPLLGDKGGPPTPDILVKNQQAAAKLKQLFNNVGIMQVKGNPLFFNKDTSISGSMNLPGAHAIASEDVPKVHSRIMDFLTFVDKVN